MKTKISEIVTIAFIAITFFSCKKEVTGNPITIWSTYTTADGLASMANGNYISSVAIDQQGNLWFGSQGSGVTKFDGTNWTIYDPQTTANAKGNTSSIWSKDFLVLFNNTLNTYWINTITIDMEGNKWFSTDDGMFEFTNGIWITYYKNYRYAPIYTNSNWWTEQGVDNYFSTVSIDSSDNNWYGSRTGIFEIDKYGKKFIYNSKNGLVNDTVTAIAPEKNGNVWFGTQNGVSEFNGDKWVSFTTANGLANNWILSIAVDAQGNKWFGTYGGGVSEFDGTNWTTYNTNNGLADNNVTSIAFDRQGNKWFGTYKGVSKFDGTHWATYTTKNGLASNYVNAIAIDKYGNKWFGTKDGVSEYRGN
jgi:ligand-binding sensor domain-containing protein